MLFITSGRVAEATRQVLADRLATVLGMVQDADGWKPGRKIPAPRTIQVTNAVVEKLDARPMPVTSVWAHLVDIEPAGHGHTGVFEVQVSTLFRSGHWDQVAREAGIWEIAVAATLDRFLAGSVDWIDSVTGFTSETGVIESEQARTLGQVDVTARVAVAGIWPGPGEWPGGPVVATTVPKVGP